MHLDLNSNMKSNINTDGRTDERDEDGTYGRLNLTAVDAGARTGDPTLIADILDPNSLWPTGRHPVIRSGERDEIPSHVRAAVWFRDRGKCELCNAPTPSGQPWHLDHITPWSAGGSDDTTNLRVLCERHNMDRGNRIDATERARRPATWWCINCYDHNDFPWRYDNGMPTCLTHNLDPSHPKPYWCRVIRGYRARWIETREWPTWHQRRGIIAASAIAYCAHCNAPGLTDVPL